MEGRIKLQKMLVLVNQLPQPDVWKQYVTEGSVREAAEKGKEFGPPCCLFRSGV